MVWYFLRIKSCGDFDLNCKVSTSLKGYHGQRQYFPVLCPALISIFDTTSLLFVDKLETFCLQWAAGTVKDQNKKIRQLLHSKILDVFDGSKKKKICSIFFMRNLFLKKFYEQTISLVNEPSFRKFLFY